MALRTSHGDTAGTGPRIETKPWDEQARPADTPGPLQTGRDAAGRVRTTAAARALARLPRNPGFAARKFACDPRFEPHNLRRLEYLARRRAEICNAWGYVSHGVGAMLSSEAWLWAAGEMCSELGAKSSDVESFRSATYLYSQAKQLALAAWELAERESKCRPTKKDDMGVFAVDANDSKDSKGLK